MSVNDFVELRRIWEEQIEIETVSNYKRLRVAGCGCEKPLVHWKPYQGLLCRLCNTKEVRIKEDT